VAANPDASPKNSPPGVDEAGLDSHVLEVAEAIADGTWSDDTAGELADSILTELQLIAKVARIHGAAVAEPVSDIASPRSLGEVLSRTLPPSATRPDLSTATRWGPLFVLDRVGGGAFGDVYRAWDPALDREVALKRLRLAQTAKSKASELVREGQLLASVRHPNVIDVHGAAAIDGELGIWMEFVRGRTLEQIVTDDGPMSADEAIVVGQSLCSALAAVHQQGLLHRDIKASNVMRAAGGRIVLLDFGTGTEADPESTATVHLAGTPLYMAPEVLKGTLATTRSDIYSLGVLLFFLVSGTYPVYGKSLAELRAAHKAGRRVSLADVRPDTPEAFSRLVEFAMVEDPKRRCPSAGTLLEKLTQDVNQRSLRWVKSIAMVGLGIVALSFLMLMFGIVNSRYFNAALARSEFANEGPLDWFYWGAVSSVAPVVLFMFAVLGLSILSVVRRLLVGWSKLARRYEGMLRDLARSRRLSDPQTSSSLALAISAIALIGTWWYFAPLLTGLLSLDMNVSTTPAENLAFLSPEFTPYHQSYRASFIWVSIVCLLVWYPVLRTAFRRGISLNWRIVAGGLAVTLLSILLMDFPYRLLVHSEFEAARWQGKSCYIIGERNEEFLLFCPSVPPPRNQTVAKTADGLERQGGKHNIFSDLWKRP
jgi:tRNA A-37 threonylcarbamoyl transferase component Bud32